MQFDKSRTIHAQTLALLSLAAMLGAAPQAGATTTIALGAPAGTGIGGNLYVPLADSYLPKGKFGLVLWEVDPSQPSGMPVPTTWNAASQTGFTPTNPGAAQMGFRNQPGTTTAQMEGDTVGAYLNSNDIPATSAGQKLMIAPAYHFLTTDQPLVFAYPTGSIDFAMDLQIPIATGGKAYAALDFEFVDPNGASISYGIALFRNNATKFSPHTGYDAPSHSFQVREPLGWDSQFASAAPGSASATGMPWLGWRHFHWTISHAQFVAALKYLASQQPGAGISTDPAHYALTKIHLNAEIFYTSAQPTTELGWSMRAASFAMH